MGCGARARGEASRRLARAHHVVELGRWPLHGFELFREPPQPLGCRRRRAIAAVCHVDARQAADTWTVWMEDIEDLTAPAAPARVARGVRVKPVVAREPTPSERAAAACECVPGTESIYVKTYGCSHNASDSEYMCGLLSQYGYRLVGEEQRASADLWLINSCTVKNPSQEHLATDISRAQGMSKPVVVAGCVSQAEPTLGALQGISLVGVQQSSTLTVRARRTGGPEVKLQYG